MKIKINLVFAILLVFASTVIAQRLPPADVTNGEPPEFQGAGRRGMIWLPPFISIFESSRLTKDAPFSAEIIIETVRSPKSGTKTVSTARYFIYRDGEGRIRRERDSLELNSPESNLYPTDRPPQLVIVDPVAKFNYELFPPNKTFTRYDYYEYPNSVQLSSIDNRHTGLIVQPPGYSWCIESLGTEIIEGLEAKGNRVTLSFADPNGNRKVVHSVSEGWFSYGLGIPLITKLSKPNGYEETIKVINIKRGAPKKSLFVVPADYKRENIVLIDKAP